MSAYELPRIADVVARLAAQVPGASTVTHLYGLDLAELLAEPAAWPALVVELLPPASLPGELLGSTHAQTIVWRVGVHVLLHRGLPGAAGAGTADDFDDLLAGVRRALAGWTPSRPGAARMRLVGGGTQQVAAGILAYRDDYEVQVLLQHVPAPSAP